MNYTAAATLAFDIANDNLDFPNLITRLEVLLPDFDSASRQALATRLWTKNLSVELDQKLLFSGSPDEGVISRPAWGA